MDLYGVTQSWDQIDRSIYIKKLDSYHGHFELSSYTNSNGDVIVDTLYPLSRQIRFRIVKTYLDLT